ncbi:unnamed protein product [Coffea canephora]|uniref:Uncharacterized protein n=1 Tax=Coffea canephora TaxID=49390 RepID=A0A068V9F2_COFCA|nr:unnamed protein product [Coffea canephora]
MKLFSLFLVAILLLQVFTEALSISGTTTPQTHQVDGRSKPPKINCSYACSRRCSKASRKNVCTRTCKACCARCNCVPPGTYGNKELCPCYARLKTRGNKPKCP